MNGTNIWADNIYTNSTSADAPEGENWVRNTDGFGAKPPYPLNLSTYSNTPQRTKGRPQNNPHKLRLPRP